MRTASPRAVPGPVASLGALVLATRVVRRDAVRGRRCPVVRRSRRAGVIRPVARAAVALALVVPALAGCAAPESATPELGRGAEEAPDARRGPSLALVVPEALLDAVVLDEARGIAASAALRSRVVVARDAAGLADQLAVLAGSGTDVTCIVGPSGAAAIAATARLFPGMRSCELVAAPAVAGTDALTVTLPVEALGAELGRLARTAAAERAGDGAPGAVALAAGPDAVFGAALRRGAAAALAAGSGTSGGGGTPGDEGRVRANGGGDGRLRIVTLSTDAAPAATVADLVADGVSVLVVDGAPGAPALVEAASSAGLVVLAPAAVVAALPEAAGEAVAVSWGVAWDAVVAAVIADVAGGPPRTSGVLDLALADVVRLTVGPAAGPVLRELVRDPSAD